MISALEVAYMVFANLLKLLPRKNVSACVLCFSSTSLKSLRRAYKGVSSDDPQSIFLQLLHSQLLSKNTFSIRTNAFFSSIWTNTLFNLDKYIPLMYNKATVAQPVVTLVLLLHLFKHQGRGEDGGGGCRSLQILFMEPGNS